MAQLSLNAMRLLGRLHRHKSAFGVERLRYDCKEQFDRTKDPKDVADELVVHGYLDTFLAGRYRRWQRTDKPYHEAMRRKLAAYAQKHAQRRKNGVTKKAVAAPVAEVDPGVAKWFGYPTHTTHLTGRVHLLDDGGSEHD